MDVGLYAPSTKRPELSGIGICRFLFASSPSSIVACWHEAADRPDFTNRRHCSHKQTKPKIRLPCPRLMHSGHKHHASGGGHPAVAKSIGHRAEMRSGWPHPWAREATLCCHQPSALRVSWLCATTVRWMYWLLPPSNKIGVNHLVRSSQTIFMMYAHFLLHAHRCATQRSIMMVTDETCSNR